MTVSGTLCGGRESAKTRSDVRGAFQSGANFRYPLVDTKRRARECAAFCVRGAESRWHHRVCDDSRSSDVAPPKSLVRNRDKGCRSEMPLFGTVPFPNGPKLSDSLVSNPLQVSRTFRKGGPFRTTLELRAYVTSTSVPQISSAAQRSVVKRMSLQALPFIGGAPCHRHAILIT